MKTEETILDYMEGTLSEEESGELLHQLSVSPEKRVILEQHIKLRDLTALAQKPVAVPQALEAGMADRFAAIAAYNREIAGGAMLAGQTAQQSFIGRMAASVAALVAQYPVRTGFAVGAAALIAYFSLSGSDQQSKFVASSSPQQVRVEQPIQNPSSSSQLHANSVSTATSSEKQYLRSGETSIQQKGIRDASSSRISEHGIVRLTDAGSQDMAPDLVANEVPPSDHSRNQHSNQNPSVVTDHQSSTIPVSNNSASENSVHDIASITPVSDLRGQSLSLDNIGHGNRTEQNPFRDREETSSGFPLAFRVYGSLGGSFVNVHQNDATLANRTEGAGLLGIDYVANPFWSFGIEGGNAAISQLITQSAVQSTFGGLPSISHVVVSNVISSSSQFYMRAVAHYTFNPFDYFHLEATAGGGMSFGATKSPIITAALYAGHDISSKASFFGGVAFAGAWTSSGVQSSVPPTLDASADPIGYVTTNHAAGTLITPSYAIRVGLKFRP